MKYPQQPSELGELNKEADRNILEFFKLLLEIDMRINPHLYKEGASEDKEEHPLGS